MMPAWEPVIAGHYTLALSVFIPAVIYLGLIFTVLGAYPFIEKWITGDNTEHHLCDRPRNNATRTAFGAFGITVYGITWLAGANDVIAVRLDVSLFSTTWFFRIAFIVLPFLVFIAVQRICLGLQRRDAEMLAHGYESGIVKRLPSGEIIEVHKPLSEDTRAHLGAKATVPRLEAGTVDANGLRKRGGPMAKLRARLNHAYVDNDIPQENGHAEPAELEESSHSSS